MQTGTIFTGRYRLQPAHKKLGLAGMVHRLDSFWNLRDSVGDSWILLPPFKPYRFEMKFMLN